jgi:serine/threonine-protein kinase
MYWRDTRQIFALAASGQFWQVADPWQEGMPADDPAYSSPPAGMMQPVRGFGLAWRSNEAIRNALGWGTLAEAPYTTTWQDFERGALFIGGGNLIYAVYPGAATHSGPLAP